MQYTLAIDGITKQKIVLEVSGVFDKPRLLVDGVVQVDNPKKNLYTLRNDENQEVIAWVRRGVFDPSPVVNINEQDIEIGVAEPFTTWQWLLIVLPLVVCLRWGLLGAAIGAWAMFFDGRLLRLPGPTPKVRFLLTLAALVGSVALSILAARFFRIWIPIRNP